MLLLTNIQYYGLVETFGGALKCVLLFGVSILLYVIAAKGVSLVSAQPLQRF
jgi:hypothetical protein